MHVTVSTTLLGLLESEPSHGYELKREYDALFGRDRQLSFGQVYGTLSRLQRDGYVLTEGTEPGGGPERKRYAITASGVGVLEEWLTHAEPPQPHLQPVLFTKVVLALLSGRPAATYLDLQRAAHLERMRELNGLRRDSRLTESLVAEYGLFHLEADLRWIDLTAARLDQLAQEVAR
jgi:DNA-binding PadR family transcriptional regulator